MGEDKQSIFQIVLLAIFGVLAVVGVVILALHRNEGGAVVSNVPIVIWGTHISKDAMTKVLNNLKVGNSFFDNVSYVQKKTTTMYGDLLEAIAIGNSPDIVIMDSSGLLPLRNKLYPISFETLPLSKFRETYVEGAEIFVFPDAIYALPIFVDPLVLYWNRSLFTKAAVAQVPKDWDTFVNLVPRLSKIVGGADLTQSAVAFGEYDNVLHAKEILSALFMQTGVSIVAINEKGFFSDMDNATDKHNSNLALDFYTSFSNPVKTVYSWNKMFDRSLESFAANKVAMYGGFVSEESVLHKINDKLNFDMSIWPQSNNSVSDVTFGRFYGVATLKASKNPQHALYVANILTNSEVAKMLSDAAGLLSVRRDVITKLDPADPSSHTKTQSAIMAKGWLEPQPQSAINDVFKRVVNGVVAGTINSSMGVSQMNGDLNALLKQYNN